MVVKKEEPIVLNDLFISIQGLIFVSTWMGMTNLNNLASLSMDASMGSWVGIPSTSVILDTILFPVDQMSYSFYTRNARCRELPTLHKRASV